MSKLPEIPPELQDLHRTVQQFSGQVKRSGELIDKIVDQQLDHLNYEVAKVKVASLLVEIYHLENAIKTIEDIARMQRREPDTQGLKNQLASAKAELSDFLQKNGLDDSFVAQVRALLEPKRWWQFWRRG